MTFEVGDIVKVIGERGSYKVIRIYDNGDIGCWGGLGGHLGVKLTVGQAEHRAFKPSKLRKVKVRK